MPYVYCTKSLYGLKQAPRAWFQRFGTHLHRLGFVSSKSDNSLFVLRRGADEAHFLLYDVDDIVLAASSQRLLDHIVNQLQLEFALKELGPVHFFLGIQVRRTADGFFLSQEQYADEVLDRAGMADCKTAPTPMDTKAKVSRATGKLCSDPTFYRSIVGALQY